MFLLENNFHLIGCITCALVFSWMSVMWVDQGYISCLMLQEMYNKL